MMNFIGNYLKENEEYVHSILDYLYYNSDDVQGCILECTNKAIRDNSFLFLKNKNINIIYRAVILEEDDIHIGYSLEKNEYENKIISWTYDYGYAEKYAETLYDSYGDEYNSPMVIIMKSDISSEDVLLSIEYIISEIKKISEHLTSEYSDILNEVIKYSDIEKEVICLDKPFKLSGNNYEKVLR